MPIAVRKLSKIWNQKGGKERLFAALGATAATRVELREKARKIVAAWKKS